MEKFLRAAILVLVFYVISFAQNNQSESCPEIYIAGPPGVTSLGEIASYTFRIDDKGKDLKLEYIWSVSSGKIVEGQGTEHVKIEQPQSAALTVTIEVKGLPQDCPNTFSEHSIFDPLPKAEKINEFLGSISKIKKSRIDRIIKAIEDDQYAQLYIIVGHKEKVPPKTRTKKEQEISNLLVKKRGISKNRITMVRTYSDRDLTQLWIVPASASSPKIEN